jgi:hypothetical protein
VRINVYAEEMTDRVEIISKEIDGVKFTGFRFYLELPVTLRDAKGVAIPGKEVSGPFIHREGDDDSSAVTFWGKSSLRPLLYKAVQLLADHESMPAKESQ